MSLGHSGPSIGAGGDAGENVPFLESSHFKSLMATILNAVGCQVPLRR
jgi:hypothetical protein